jgi:hypothetical protein
MRDNEKDKEARKKTEARKRSVRKTGLSGNDWVISRKCPRDRN